MRNKVDEVHQQFCKFLVTNFDLILFPTFETSQMVSRYERKIATKTARQMLNWGHYRFKQRLLFKVQQCGSKVAIVNEAYTSKTCSCCGFLKHNIGGAKRFNCDRCGADMDRDINATKGIFLKNHEGLNSASGPPPFCVPIGSQMHGYSECKLKC